MNEPTPTEQVGPFTVRVVPGMPPDRIIVTSGKSAVIAVNVGDGGETVHGLLQTPLWRNDDGVPAAWCLCGEQFTGKNLGAAHEAVFAHAVRR